MVIWGVGFLAHRVLSIAKPLSLPLELVEQ